MGGIGIAAHVYPRVVRAVCHTVYDYTVTDVQRLNEMTAEVFLQPVA